MFHCWSCLHIIYLLSLLCLWPFLFLQNLNCWFLISYLHNKTSIAPLFHSCHWIPDAGCCFFVNVISVWLVFSTDVTGSIMPVAAFFSTLSQSLVCSMDVIGSTILVAAPFSTPSQSLIGSIKCYGIPDASCCICILYQSLVCSINVTGSSVATCCCSLHTISVAGWCHWIHDTSSCFFFSSVSVMLLDP